MYPGFSNRDEEKFLNNNYLFTVESSSGERPLERILENGVLLEMLINSGAMENMIHDCEYQKLYRVTLDLT